MRTCSSCKIDKDISRFSPDKEGRDGYHAYCKDCNNIRNRERYKKNKDIISKKHAEWRAKNPEYMSSYRKKNIEDIRKKATIARKKNANKIKEYTKLRKQKDPIFRIRCNITSRLWVILKKRTAKKPCKVKQALGCTVKELKIHLENKFVDGMNWDNYGKWHVDHIIPLCSFDLTKEEDFKKANHYTNLQPLWALDNLLKGGNVYVK